MTPTEQEKLDEAEPIKSIGGKLDENNQISRRAVRF